MCNTIKSWSTILVYLAYDFEMKWKILVQKKTVMFVVFSPYLLDLRLYIIILLKNRCNNIKQCSILEKDMNGVQFY